MRTFWVYILGSRSGTLYVGVTDNLERRLAEHRMGLTGGFTSQYAVHRLLYFEQTTDVVSALAREKQLKRYTRRRKIELIKTMNPAWKDLSTGW